MLSYYSSTYCRGHLVPDHKTVYNMLLLENKTGERVTMVIDENDKPLGRETKYSYYDLRNSYTTSLMDK